VWVSSYRDHVTLLGPSVAVRLPVDLQANDVSSNHTITLFEQYFGLRLGDIGVTPRQAPSGALQLRPRRRGLSS